MSWNHNPPIDRDALVAPSRHHPALDPVVQTFLDRCGEGHAADGSLYDDSQTDLEMLRPQGCEVGTVPVIVYIHARSFEDRGEALQSLADRSGAAVLPIAIVPDAGPAAAERRVSARLASLTSASRAGVDRSRLALAGDGLGALVALACAGNSRLVGCRPSLLVLITPVLGPPADGFGTHRLGRAAAEDFARSAIRLAGPDGWPVDRARERLMRLPPILLLTAEIDPFRDAAEDFARKMMAADHDISANRSLGMIHDFAWLPALLYARGAVDAQRVVACALREAFSSSAAEAWPAPNGSSSS